MFGISWFDIAAFVILVLSGVMAFARGLIREVFSIIALIGAGIAAIFLAGRVAPFIEGLTPIESGVLAWLTGGLLVFLVVFLVLTIIISVVAKTAHQSAEIGAFDRAGGAFFGVVRGILVVALFLVLMRQVTGSPAVSPQAVMPAQITRAWSYPGFEAVAIALERIFPGARQLATDYIRGRQRESAPIPPAAAPASTPEPAPAAPAEPKAASKKG